MVNTYLMSQTPSFTKPEILLCVAFPEQAWCLGHCRPTVAHFTEGREGLEVNQLWLWRESLVIPGQYFEGQGLGIRSASYSGAFLWTACPQCPHPCAILLVVAPLAFLLYLVTCRSLILHSASSWMLTHHRLSPFCDCRAGHCLFNIGTKRRWWWSH